MPSKMPASLVDAEVPPRASVPHAPDLTLIPAPCPPWQRKSRSRNHKNRPPCSARGSHSPACRTLSPSPATRSRSSCSPAVRRIAQGFSRSGAARIVGGALTVVAPVAASRLTKPIPLKSQFFSRWPRSGITVAGSGPAHPVWHGLSRHQMRRPPAVPRTVPRPSLRRKNP